MREKRYTAGPWFIRPRPTDDGLAVIEDGRSNGLHPITCEWSEAPIVSAAPDLLEALEALNAEIDALWNTPPENKYIDGRLSNALVQRITVAQQSALSALAKAYGESE